MSDPMVERVQRNPKYQQLKQARSRFGWTLAEVAEWMRRHKA